MNHKITIGPGDELTITFKIDGTIVTWLADRVYPLLQHKCQQVNTTALALMVGISDDEAVQQANEYAEKNGWPERTTVDEFRKWLPAMLSKLFAQEITH